MNKSSLTNALSAIIAGTCKRSKLTISLALLGTLAAQTATNTASITGKVREENGAPVQAIVTATSGTAVQRALAGPDGSFHFSNLRSGTYSLCAQAPLRTETGKVDDYFVDSCAWLDASAPRVTLAPAEARSQVILTMKRGRLLAIRVNDPGKLLPPPTGKHSGNHLSLRIAGSSGLVHRIPITGQDTAGRNHSIVIPYDTPHKLWIDSSTFALNDELGRNALGTATDVQVAHGDPPKTYVVTVAAKAGKQ